MQNLILKRELYGIFPEKEGGKVKKAEKCVLAILLMSGMIFFSGCATDKGANPGHRLVTLISYMQKTVGGEVSSMMMVEPVRAEDGLAMRISGREVAFYKYDLTRPKAKKKYDHIKATGEVYISGIRYKAELNGPFMMIDHDRNMKREEILKAFQNFR